MMIFIDIIRFDEEIDAGEIELALCCGVGTETDNDVAMKL